MKKILYIPIFAIMLVLTGCSDVLEREQIYQVSSDTYYSTPAEIESALAASYSCMSGYGLSHMGFVDNLLSDQSFGGGALGDVKFHNIDAFNSLGTSEHEAIWSACYAGILRANLVLEKIDNVTYESEADKNQAKGEALFLRAYFHFRLTQYFGNITLKPTSNVGEDTQASYDDIYDLIGSSLKEAIEIMPATPISQISKAERGRITKWAAESYMARVWMFYTGYHNKSELVLSDGSSITKANVITWLDDCIANSGHYLHDDFRELWPISSTASDTAGDYSYPYAVNNNLEWVGDSNDESVFMVKYSVIYSNWGETQKYGNSLGLHSGVRGQKDWPLAYPFGEGWGGATVNPQLFDAYDENDVRRNATIIDVYNAEEGYISDNYEIQGGNDNLHETGYFNKKYTSVNYNDGAGNVAGMYYVMHGGTSSFMLNLMQDWVIIRYADVLLMAAELKEDVSLINQVRERAHVATLGAYSLENLQHERKLELAYECVRYWDLLRWGIAEQEFGKVVNVPIHSEGNSSTYTATYRPETKGLLSIPESQINISNGGLVQNPGW